MDPCGLYSGRSKVHWAPLSVGFPGCGGIEADDQR